MVDIKLRHWAEQALPHVSVECGWETLKLEFEYFMKKAALQPEHDNIFDLLKTAVVNEAMERHSWEDKASEMLRVIQLNTLEDRTVSDKRDWDTAVKFLESSVKEKLKTTEEHLNHILGPSFKEKWLYWKYSTDEQLKRSAVKAELDNILHADEVNTKSQIIHFYLKITILFRNIHIL